MSCRKEKYILLEQSVTVDSKEVDALVTQIGEALQLHNNASAYQKAMSCLHSHSSSGGSSARQTNGSSARQTNSSSARQTNNSSAAHQRRHGCCLRLRNRGLRSRASPYSIPGSSDQELDRFKSWNRKRAGVSNGENDDPHQLLQELILSGNLIKEAVRRLQFTASEHADHSNSADSLQYL